MKRANIKQFVINNKKQIIFALFAFVYFLINRDNDVNFMVVTEAAAAAASAASKKAIAAAAKKAAIQGAKAGAIKGGIEGTNNASEDESQFASAIKGATFGAAKGAASGAIGAKTGMSFPNKNNDGLAKTKGLSSNSISSLNDSDGFSKQNFDSMASSFGNSFKNKTKGLFSREKDDGNNTTESVQMEKAFELSPGMIFGCVSALLIVLVVSIPLLLILYVNPVSSTISEMDVEENENAKSDDKLSVFLEKAKNFFAYGSFTENEDVIVDKIEEIYNKMIDEHGVTINVPLLLSTLFSDASAITDEFDNESNNLKINSLLLSRLDYIYDVALLQVGEDYIVYKCNSKNVDNEIVYYKEINYTKSSDEVIEGECNSSNVGKYLKEMSSGIISSSSYYEILKENQDLLIKIYGEEKASDENIDSLIEEIKMQKDVFDILYENEDDETSGNLPLVLFYDDNINFTSPIKGNYSITSPFGNRTGLFAGMHKGMDIISNDLNIYAAGDGIVTAVYTETLGGNVIEITHTTSNGDKYISQYGHLSKFLTTKGSTVKAGDIIGIMGATGVVSGVHLHFQVWKVEPYTLYNPENVFTKSN